MRSVLPQRTARSSPAHRAPAPEVPRRFAGGDVDIAMDGDMDVDVRLLEEPVVGPAFPR
jgi:hypothetical protein